MVLERRLCARAWARQPEPVYGRLCSQPQPMSQLLLRLGDSGGVSWRSISHEGCSEQPTSTILGLGKFPQNKTVEDLMLCNGGTCILRRIWQSYQPFERGSLFATAVIPDSVVPSFFYLVQGAQSDSQGRWDFHSASMVTQPTTTTHYYMGIFAVTAAAGNHIVFHDPHSIRIGLVSLEIRKAPTFSPLDRTAWLSD
jgi:hypothetical protein